jgi:outer membrane phospholipase A
MGPKTSLRLWQKKAQKHRLSHPQQQQQQRNEIQLFISLNFLCTINLENTATVLLTQLHHKCDSVTSKSTQ